MLLASCATNEPKQIPEPAPAPEQESSVRADYLVPACNSAAAVGMVFTAGLVGYVVGSGFVNKWCAELGR